MTEPEPVSVPSQDRRGAEKRPSRVLDAVQIGWAAMVAFVVIYSAWLNGSSQSSHFWITLTTGIGLLLLPPRRQLPSLPLLAAAALLLLSASALLPASWLGLNEPWRTTLVTDWQMPAMDRVSPQPFLTQGALLTLLVGCLWFFMLVGRAFPEQAKRMLLTVTALGIVLLAAVALAERFGWLTTGWPYQASRTTSLDMGPFTNRNHFSGLCAIGCALCAGLAQDGWKRRSPWWPLFATALLLPFSAIAMNTSRGGLLLFFIGMMAWLAVSATRYSWFSRLTVMASLAIGASAVLLLYGEGSFARLSQENLEAPRSLLGLRGNIYQATLPLLPHRLWTGTGLSNFAPVFALESPLQLPTLQVLHPESSWLMLAFEAGPLALLPFAVALLWLGRNALPSASNRRSRSQRRDTTLRSTAAIGAGLAALHALFDVPLHNFSLACLALMLAACAVSKRHLEKPSRLPVSLLFRLAGAALLVVAAGHYSGLQGKPVLPGRFHVNTLAAEARALSDADRFPQALALLDQVIQLAPLRWEAYYQRALVRLALRQSPDEALADFSRVRALRPGLIPVRMEEGRVWLRHRPELAILPWRELLSEHPAPNLYETMLDLARPHPALRGALSQLAVTPPLMASLLLRTPTPTEWQKAHEQLRQADPTLASLSSTQRHAVLRSWITRGDAQALLDLLPTQPEWERDAWQDLADLHARRSEFEPAWALLHKHGLSSASITPSSNLPLGQLEREFVQHPTDLKRGIDLYFAQKKRALTTEARRTLDKLLALPSPPVWLRQEQAVLTAEQGDFRRAYELMKATLAPAR